jgi:hypothetical protein
MRVGKQLQTARGLLKKTGIVTAKKERLLMGFMGC